MKNVLMISYCFPPMGGSGVQRTMYFAKYLPEFGYRPLVLHGAGRPGNTTHDPTLLAELGNHVARLEFPAFEPACLTTPLMERLTKMGTVGRALAWRVGQMTAGMEARLSPDALVLWARRVVAPVLRAIERANIDVIYSTADPFSNHYVAWRLKQQTGLPWVADFRDLWTMDKSYSRRRGASMARDRRYEQLFLESADTIVNVSEGYSRAMESLAPHVPRERFHVIRNGADMRQSATKPRQPNSVFTLRFIGTLYRDQWSEALVDALTRLRRQLRPASPVRFEIVGRNNSRYQSARSRLGEMFVCRPYVPHSEARELMASADALLLTVNRGRNIEGTVPGKLYEYLASGRPILCLTPLVGETAHLVQNHRAGLVANIDSADEIYAALWRMYDAWAQGRLMCGADPADLRQYDRHELTRQLSLIFNRCLAASRGRLLCESA